MRIRIRQGRLRGQWIETQPGMPYRPLVERLRLAFFDHAAETIQGRRFLDGFAGAGTVGIYALSLGADHATFIEVDRSIARLLRQNLRRLGLLERTTVRVGDIRRVVRRKPPAPFAWIFLGPPYGFPTEAIEHLMGALVHHRWATGGSRLAIQRFKKDPIPQGSSWELYRTLIHGDNVIYLYGLPETIP